MPFEGAEPALRQKRGNGSLSFIRSEQRDKAKKQYNTKQEPAEAGEALLWSPRRRIDIAPGNTEKSSGKPEYTGRPQADPEREAPKRLRRHWLEKSGISNSQSEREICSAGFCPHGNMRRLQEKESKEKCARLRRAFGQRQKAAAAPLKSQALLHRPPRSPDKRRQLNKL